MTRERLNALIDNIRDHYYRLDNWADRPESDSVSAGHCAELEAIETLLAGLVARLTARGQCPECGGEL